MAFSDFLVRPTGNNLVTFAQPHRGPKLRSPAFGFRDRKHPPLSKRKTLVQWIGHSDLRAMAGSLSASRRDTLIAKLGGPLPKAGDQGPTRTLLNTQPFDEVHLISNYRSDWNRWYRDWLGTACT